MAQAGVNPHAAADLLRQAMAHNARQESREDVHDHIGSNSPTPSGVETPRPDFTDKRLPGIMPSYFGQVGAEPSSSSPSRDTSAVCTPNLASGVESCSSKHVHQSLTDAAASDGLIKTESSTQSASDRIQSQGADAVPSVGPSGLLAASTSTVSAEPQRNGAGAETSTPAADSGFASITQALKNFVKPKSTLSSRHQSTATSSVDKQTASAHISNPTSRQASFLALTPPLSEKNEHSPSVQELSRLTLDAASESRGKNTPPMTPRALSHEDRTTGQRSPLSRLSANASEDGVSNHSNDSLTKTKTTDLPTSSPRGKLAVRIAEGRGLKQAADPYCVCVFEWNEYISKGPKQDKMEVDDPSHSGSTPQLSSIPIQRSTSDMGRPMAIPMRSRQSSSNGVDKESPSDSSVTNPKWDHEATFDVTSEQSEIDISVYDRRAHDAFLGHVRLSLDLSEKTSALEKWCALKPRGPEDTDISGEILIKVQFSKTDKKHFGPNDFQILKLVGKGTFGQVYQVRKKDTQRIYAMKVLSKKVIIQKKEIAHTIGERNILVRTAMTDSPFIVGLKFSFQTPTDLYLVTDFMSGGELFWHLQKEGRFKEDRAKFYIAELILALKHLHEHDIVYRDLKPENILLDANGHIALCDFGLSKANLTQNDTTNTFCGTTEYLAPEVLLDEQGYTKMVDFWSLGVLVFEMCCGWSPFYAEDTQQMYKNIAFGKVRFPRDALSTEGRNFVKGLLNRNPKHRLGATRDAQELIEHPFFADIDWDALAKKNLPPPFKPKLTSVADTSHFDPEFTNALNTSSSLNARAAALAAGAGPASTPLSPTMQNAFAGFTFVDDSAIEQHMGDVDNDSHTDADELTRINTNENRMSGIRKTGTTDDFFGGEGDWNM